MVRITIDIDEDGTMKTDQPATEDSAPQPAVTQPPRLSEIEVDEVINAGPAPVGDDLDEPEDLPEVTDEYGDDDGMNAGAAPE